MTKATTAIGPNTRVNGRIIGDTTVDVYGYVRGEIDLHDTLTVHEHAVIDGDIAADNIVVNGTVRGQLRVRNHLVLGPNARVVATIRTHLFTVADGAVVSGNIETHIGAADSAKPLEFKSAVQPLIAADPAQPSDPADFSDILPQDLQNPTSNDPNPDHDPQLVEQDHPSHEDLPNVEDHVENEQQDHQDHSNDEDHENELLLDQPVDSNDVNQPSEIEDQNDDEILELSDVYEVKEHANEGEVGEGEAAQEEDLHQATPDEAPSPADDYQDQDDDFDPEATAAINLSDLPLHTTAAAVPPPEEHASYDNHEVFTVQPHEDTLHLPTQQNEGATDTLEYDRAAIAQEYANFDDDYDEEVTEQLDIKAYEQARDYALPTPDITTDFSQPDPDSHLYDDESLEEFKNFEFDPNPDSDRLNESDVNPYMLKKPKFDSFAGILDEPSEADLHGQTQTPFMQAAKEADSKDDFVSFDQIADLKDPTPLNVNSFDDETRVAKAPEAPTAFVNFDDTTDIKNQISVESLDELKEDAVLELSDDDIVEMETDSQAFEDLRDMLTEFENPNEDEFATHLDIDMFPDSEAIVDVFEDDSELE